jgi:predicted PurR-regulated permease PerM
LSDPNEPRVVSWLKSPRVLATVISLVLWAFIVSVLVAFREVLLPFGVAVLLAFIMEPVITFATSKPIFGRTLPRLGVIIALYVILAFVLWWGITLTLPQVGQEVAKLINESNHLLRALERRFVELLDSFDAFAQENQLPIYRAGVQDFIRSNLEAAADQVRTNASQLFTFGRDVVASAFRTVFGVFLVLMLTAFLSIDGPRIERFAKSLVPSNYHGGYDEIVSGLSSALAGVVRGQLLICVANGVLTFVGLMILQVKFPFLLALIATSFSLVPIFGSILSTVPIVAIAIAESPAKAIFVLLWIIAIHLLEANLLNPKIMGDASKIHPLLVVFVLMVGERTAGLVGALFAVPIAAVVVTFFKFLHRRALAQEARTPA